MSERNERREEGVEALRNRMDADARFHRVLSGYDPDEVRDFLEEMKRVLAQQAKARYEAYIGYCYGKKKDSGRGKPKMYQELAGKRFWTELTGDEEFYIKIIGYMGTMPEKYVASCSSLASWASISF